MSPVSNADQQKSLSNSTSEISSSPTLLLEQQMLQQQQQQQQQQQWPVFVDKSQQVAGHLELISKLSFIFEKKDVDDNSVCDDPKLRVETLPTHELTLALFYVVLR